jgi:hypothetical protein
MKRFAAICALLSAWTSLASAQCVMCFRTAAAQQIERARVLNFGILVMMVPPVVILGGFLMLAWRKNSEYAGPDDKIADGETLHTLAAGDGHVGDRPADD